MNFDQILIVLVFTLGSSLLVREIFPRTEVKEILVPQPAPHDATIWNTSVVLGDWQRAYWRRVGHNLELLVEHDGAFPKSHLQILQPKEWSSSK